MAYTREQARQVFNAKMRTIMLRNAKLKQEEDEKDRDAWNKKQSDNAKLSLLLKGLNIGQTQGEKVQAKLLRDTFDAGGGVLMPKYKFKDPTKWYDVPEKIKRYVDPKSELMYRPEYREEVVGESVDPTFEETSLFPEGTRPGGEKGIMTASEYDELVRERQRQYEYQEWMENKGSRGIDILDQDPTVQDTVIVEPQADLLTPPTTDPQIYSPAEMDEFGNVRDTTVPPPTTSPDYPEIQRQADLYEPTVPAPPDYEKIQAGADIAQEQQLQRLRDIETAPGVAPTVSADPDLEKALEDLEGLKAPKVKGADEVLPELFRASVGMSDMPDVEAPITDVDVPDVKPGFGKTFQALKTSQDMLDIGRTITDENATDEEKGVATVRGTKILSDIALKRAKKEGTKALAKGVGTAAGGLLGGYTMVTEAKEAGEAWEEKDYDEAILHGIGSVSGGLQTAGAGMMLSGVGAPLGAILFGVGTAASAISSVGLMFEGLFGGDDASAEVQKPKFNYGRYFESIRRR